MKKRIVVAMLSGVLFTLSAVAQTGTCSLKVLDVGSWVESYVRKVQVIPKKTAPGCLIAYAAKLTREHPGVNYEFYDSQSNDLNAYIRGQRALWSAMSSGQDFPLDNIPAEYRYSDKWLHKHHIANLLASSETRNPPVDGNGCQQWVLRSEDDKTLATFDHICPAR